jgi:hypothetical protein
MFFLLCRHTVQKPQSMDSQAFLTADYSNASSPGICRGDIIFPFFSLPAWFFIDPGKLDSG